MLGGGMRQAGVIAAAALHAIEADWHGIMAMDHQRARHFAEAVSTIPGFHSDPLSVKTNIVYAEVDTRIIDMDVVAATLKAQGVLITAAYAWGACEDEHHERVRFVFHRDVCDASAEAAAGMLRAAALV